MKSTFIAVGSAALLATGVVLDLKSTDDAFNSANRLAADAAVRLLVKEGCPAKGVKTGEIIQPIPGVINGMLSREPDQVVLRGVAIPEVLMGPNRQGTATVEVVNYGHPEETIPSRSVKVTCGPVPQPGTLRR